MRYLVNTTDIIDDIMIDSFRRSRCEVVFSSKYAPVSIVEADSIICFDELNFVKCIEEAQEGEYLSGEYTATIQFNPRLRKSLLVNEGCLGWGDVNVGILDSGVDPTKFTLASYSVFDGTVAQDTVGHGTIVASIVHHFAPGANIHALKIGSKKPLSECLVQAIEYAIDNKFDIINISSDYNKDISCDGSCPVCSMCQAAVENNVCVVVAAGNGYGVVGSIYCPARSPYVITVGAVGVDESSLADFSSKGLPGESKPNILAPGTVYIDANTHSGTSYSAPIIVGVLSAILRKTSGIKEAVGIILSTAIDCNLPRHEQGQGRLAIEKIVEVIKDEESNNIGCGQVKN